MISRFQVTVKPPDQFEAAGHEARVGHFLVGSAEDRTHRLLQDQTDAEGGKQGLQGSAIEEADDAPLQNDAHQGGKEESHRQGDDQIEVDPGGRHPGAKGFLDHIGGVAAQHDHLAMGHIDDPHDAESDGKTDGGQQQDAAQGQALEQIGGKADGGQFVVDGGQHLLGGGLDLGVWLGGDQALQLGLHTAVGRAGQGGDGGQAAILVGRDQIKAGQGRLQSLLHAGVALVIQGLAQQLGGSQGWLGPPPPEWP